jgi:streptogramin lyase
LRQTRQKTALPAGWNTRAISCRREPCSALDANVYVLAVYSNFSLPLKVAVFQVATTGQIVKKFSLESSNPQSMTAGPDGNLWITEGYTATEPSKIARLDPDTGAVAQFTVSTSNVGLASIRKGYDGALWFTESATNKIGRITTAGRITEYSVPTAASEPNGIIPCPTTVCGDRGGVWLAETAANKLARYDFP